VREIAELQLEPTIAVREPASERSLGSRDFLNRRGLGIGFTIIRAGELTEPAGHLAIPMRGWLHVGLHTLANY
jgi:hypothetical protein